MKYYSYTLSTISFIFNPLLQRLQLILLVVPVVRTTSIKIFKKHFFSFLLKDLKTKKLHNITYLVEVSQIGNLVPQVSHDLLVFLECGFIPVAFAFNDGVANGQAFEIVLIQETVVVDVVHVPDDELDSVIPWVCHCAETKMKAYIVVSTYLGSLVLYFGYTISAIDVPRYKYIVFSFLNFRVYYCCATTCSASRYTIRTYTV